MDRRNLLAAGSNDRLDELAIRVLVPSIEELAERVGAIGPLVVDAAEIQRSQRVVRGTDNEQAGEPAGELLERITQGRSLERGQLFAGTASKIAAARAQLVDVRGRLRGRHQNHLFGSCGSDLLEQARQAAWTIADAMCLPAPWPFGRERQEVRIDGQGQRQRPVHGIEYVLACGTSQIECFEMAASGVELIDTSPPAEGRLGLTRAARE